MIDEYEDEHKRMRMIGLLLAGLLLMFIGGVTGRTEVTAAGAFGLVLAGLHAPFLAVRDLRRLLAWWRERPAVVERRRRKRAMILAKLNAQASARMRELGHVKEVMDALPLGSSPEALRLLTMKYASLHDFVRRFGLNSMFTLSPLHGWLRDWVIIDGTWDHGTWSRLKTGWPGWDAQFTLETALKLQHEGWRSELDECVDQLRQLQSEIDALSAELGVESRNYLEPDVPRVRVEPPVETKRDKLAKLREEADKLEEEILADEQERSPGPHRRAAGIPKRD